MVTPPNRTLGDDPFVTVTSKRAAARRIELPPDTARATPSQRSCDKGSVMAKASRFSQAVSQNGSERQQNALSA